MRIFRILPVILAAAVCCSAQAQPALKHLSGDFVLTRSIDLTNEGIVPFSAQLRSYTGESCQLTGNLRVFGSSPRRVETVPGATFIHCPGVAPALVAGHIVPANWIPPQSRQCSGYSHSKYGSSCRGYWVTAPAGAPGMWLTWKSLPSEQVAQKKGAHHD